MNCTGIQVYKYNQQVTNRDHYQAYPRRGLLEPMFFEMGNVFTVKCYFKPRETGRKLHLVAFSYCFKTFPIYVLA